MASEIKTREQCVHHWIVDNLNVGRCKKCFMVKDFGSMLRRQAAKREQIMRDIGRKGVQSRLAKISRTERQS